LIRIPPWEYEFRVDLVRVYECLCDRTRLRLLNVLTRGPLCVCHFQAVLREPQVKISKHLAYLRARRLVECTRHGNWIVYQLPARRPRALDANLACLQDCTQTDSAFQRDLARLARLAPEIARAHRENCGLGRAKPVRAAVAKTACACQRTRPARR
jgi:ArsR family transcriptional regulator